MEIDLRIEAALEEAVAAATVLPCPSCLAEAIRYAIFPGGGRVRPGFCLAVAKAYGDPDPALADAAAVAVEVLHCASLVQDDLPCFDDAPVRRGQPSLHKRFGQEIAILVGDAMIVMAFRAVAGFVVSRPAQAAAILGALVRAAGAPSGIAAGQAWESEHEVDVGAYHHAKTAALFEAAAIAGAIAGGAPCEPWRLTAGLLGEAYQIADDLADALGDAGHLGKPVHQDDVKARPSMVADFGIAGAVTRFDDLLGRAMQGIPECPGRKSVQDFLRTMAHRLCPPGLRGETAREKPAALVENH